MSKRDVLAQDELDSQVAELYRTIGENIQRHMKSEFNRKKRKLTQEDLAQAVFESTGVEVSRTTISRWISGTRRPSIQDILILCELFDCSVEELCGRKAKKRDNEAAERYTGLSQEAVRYLHDMPGKELSVLDKLLSKGSGFSELLQALSGASSSPKTVAYFEQATDAWEEVIEEEMKRKPYREDPLDYDDSYADYLVPLLGYEDVYINKYRLERIWEALDYIGTNQAAIMAESSKKDLTIRQYYNLLEKSVADVKIRKWTNAYIDSLRQRVLEYARKSAFTLDELPKEAQETLLKNQNEV